MYHPEIIDRNLFAVGKSLPFKLKRYELGDSVDRQVHLASLWDDDKNRPLRPLADDEQKFVLNELTLCKFDYRYFANRYCFLNDSKKGGGIIRISFWDSQEIALDHIAKWELEAWKIGGDNLVAWWKARQMGATAVCESMGGHRLFFYGNTRVLIASNKDDASLELSRRIELIYDLLPWWMKPHRKYRVKGTEMFFDKLNNSLIIGHGATEGGGIGQGGTFNFFHLTEIPDWANTEQIDDDLLPAVPRHPTSTGFAESTAKKRNDYWHKLCVAAWAGKSRFKGLFIPWYAETHNYRANPPEGWEPAAVTLAHAKKVEEQSPTYCLGKTVRLSLEQMYWWERMYEEYRSRGKLATLNSEFAADHLTAFQHSGQGMFPTDQLEQARLACAQPEIYQLVNVN